MNRISRVVVILALIAIPLAGMVATSGTASAAPEPKPFFCPEDWVPVSPPVNPVIRCLPNQIAPNGNRGEPAPKPFGSVDGQCPEGWKRAVHPVNPALGCLPDTLAPRGD